MEDDFDEYDELLDDDPAVDYILYEDMERKGEQNGSGCFGVMAILILPLAVGCYGLIRWA